MTRIDEDEVYNNYIAPGEANFKFSTLGRSHKTKNQNSYYNHEYDESSASNSSNNGIFIRAGSIKSLVKYPTGTISKIWSKRRTQSERQMELSTSTNDSEKKSKHKNKLVQSESVSPSPSFNNGFRGSGRLYGGRDTMWYSEIDLTREVNFV